MNERAFKDEDITDVAVVDIDKLQQAQRSVIVRPVDIEGTIQAYKEFERLKKELLNENDFAYFDESGKMTDKKTGNPYIKKSGWRKMKTAFGTSIEYLDDGKRTLGKDSEGEYYVWRYKVRAITPSGIYQDSDGACSSRKAFFSKKYGKRVDPEEEDIILMAQTVAINRAISDLVGGGEVSAEEMYGRENSTPKPLMETNPKQAILQQQKQSDYGLDPETYKLSGGKHIGIRMIDCPTNYIEWNIQQAKTSKFKQTFEKVPMDIWIEFLEVCLQIHIANKELKAKPVTDKDLEPEIEGLESDFANIEVDSIEDIEKHMAETFPGITETAHSKATKHIKEVLK